MGAGGDASGVPSTALVVPRDDTAYVEWLASELCSATQNTTAPWSVCEIWRAQGRQARIPAGWGPPPSNPEPTPVTDDDVEQISLVFGAGAQRGCYSPMRAPRGHTPCGNQPARRASGEEPAPPRRRAGVASMAWRWTPHRAGVASMAWRRTRRFGTEGAMKFLFLPRSYVHALPRGPDRQDAARRLARHF